MSRADLIAGASAAVLVVGVGLTFGLGWALIALGLVGLTVAVVIAYAGSKPDA